MRWFCLSLVRTRDRRRFAVPSGEVTFLRECGRTGNSGHAGYTFIQDRWTRGRLYRVDKRVRTGALPFYIRSSEMDIFISSTTDPYQNHYPQQFQCDMPVCLLPIYSVGVLAWWRPEPGSQGLARARANDNTPK